jgi:alkylation response protein AidB-like acyl-CoA dehydrogenase
VHFDFDELQADIQSTARDLLARRATAERVRAAAEAHGVDAALWAELAELGWPGVAIDEAHGGQGLGMVELCVLLEEQGAALAPTPLLPSACAARVIERAGTDAQRDAWLPALADGSASGAIGFTAREDDVPLVAGAVGADVLVVVAGDRAVLHDGRSATIEPVETIDRLRSYGRVDGEGDPLPGDVAPGVAEAAVAVAAELTGVCRRALDMTVEYVKQREQFGAPVGRFQAVSHRCAEMLLATESARSAVLYAAWAADAAQERLPEAAALAKSVASDAGVAVTAAAIQAHGGVGFTWEADVHWLYKRAQLDAQLLGGAGHHRARLAELVAGPLVAA